VKPPSHKGLGVFCYLLCRKGFLYGAKMRGKYRVFCLMHNRPEQLV